MKPEIYDVFFEKHSIWTSYNITPDSIEEFEKIKEWVKFDKNYSDIISDYVIHENYVTVLQEHPGNEVTYKEMLKQISDFHSWFDEFLHPSDESGIF